MASKNKKQTENIFKNKVILLGLTGGIAAYKICFLINKLKKAGAQIRLIASENALNFITKTTLQTLAKTPVLTQQFDLKKYDINHKSLSSEVDLFILAPASANTIAKVAQGIADNLLTSVLCAWQKPLLIAPAMNGGMWYNPATQQNIKLLEKRGTFILEPQTAETSVGQITKGPMADIERIFDTAQNILALQNKFKNKKVLIAGGNICESFEKTNLISSEICQNKAKIMADTFYLSGAEVILINNETFEVPYKQILAQNRAQYKEEILKQLNAADIFVFAAKLPIWQIAEQKKEGKNLLLTLAPSSDFLAEVLEQKPAPTLVLDLRQKEFDAQNLFKTAFEIAQEI